MRGARGPRCDACVRVSQPCAGKRTYEPASRCLRDVELNALSVQRRAVLLPALTGAPGARHNVAWVFIFTPSSCVKRAASRLSSATVVLVGERRSAPGGARMGSRHKKQKPEVDDLAAVRSPPAPCLRALADDGPTAVHVRARVLPTPSF